MTDTMTEQTPRQKVNALIAELGLTITAEFVPYSQSRHAKLDPWRDKPWRSLNWRVTVNVRELKRRDDEGKDYHLRPILTTDYTQGEGHCPAYKAAALGNPKSIMRDKAIAMECETGRRYAVGGFGGSKLTPPAAADVLCSLVSDSDVLDCSKFEEWASNLGYDTDSRSAEAIYRSCLEIALKLRNGLGDTNLQRLREAFQDY